MLHITDVPFSVDMLDMSKGSVQVGFEKLDLEEVRDAIVETSAGLNSDAVFMSQSAAGLLRKELPIYIKHNTEATFSLKPGDEMIVVKVLPASVPDHGVFEFIHIWVE